MYRSISYTSEDKHCRYLGISLCNGWSRGICGGRFGQYLKDHFGLEKLPYDISATKLLLTKALTPDLFVELPKSFFKNWSNFPEHPAMWVNKLAVDTEVAKYDIHFRALNPSVNDLHHPYDTAQLNADFAHRFKTEVPQRIRTYKISDYHYFSPYEAYFAYWRGYLLIDSLIGYFDIENFLSPIKGTRKLVERIYKTNSLWNNKYKSTFNRISYYRTAKSILISDCGGSDLTYYEISNSICSLSGTTEHVLESDMELLLTLFDKWRSEIKNHGHGQIRKALDLLRQDIYLLFEWLATLTDRGEAYYFKKWSYGAFRTASWAELKEVICYEDFDLRKHFSIYGDLYAREIGAMRHQVELEKCYDRLTEILSFRPWIRALSDMHKSLNKNSILHFSQPRFLDYLIVITIRTEIVIRDMYSSRVAEGKCVDHLYDAIRGLALFSGDRNFIKISDLLRQDWAKTKLNCKPHDLFKEIDALPTRNGCSKGTLHIYKQMLRFVASRNYFAHHSYKDEIINSRRDTMVTDVLKACMQTLIFINSTLHKDLPLALSQTEGRQS
jgi:hypothetical protein